MLLSPTPKELTSIRTDDSSPLAASLGQHYLSGWAKYVEWQAQQSGKSAPQPLPWELKLEPSAPQPPSTSAAEVEGLTNQITELQAQLKEAKQEKQIELIELRAENFELRTQLDNAQAQTVREHEAELETFSNELKAAQNEGTVLREQLLRTDEQLSRVQNQLTVSNQELSAKEDVIRSLNTKLQASPEKDIEGLKEQLAAATTEVAVLKAQHQSSIQAKRDTEEEFFTFKKQSEMSIANLKLSLERQSKEVIWLENQVADLQKANDSLGFQLQGTQAKPREDAGHAEQVIASDIAEAEVQGLKNSVDMLSHQLDDEKQKRLQGDQERSNAEDKVAILTAEVASLQQEIAAFRSRRASGGAVGPQSLSPRTLNSEEKNPKDKEKALAQARKYLKSQGLTWSLTESGKGTQVTRIPTGGQVTTEDQVEESGLELEC